MGEAPGKTDPETLDREIAEYLVRLTKEEAPEIRARIMGNLARRMNWIGRFDQAERLMDRALMLSPDDPTLLRSSGLALFGAGRWAEGLALYDRGRWQLEDHQKFRRAFPHAEWQGEAVAGKNLLLWAEQGVGDQIMQARVIEPLREAGANITVECDPRLHPLLARSYDDPPLATQTVDLPSDLVNGPFDFHGSLFSAWRWADLTAAADAYLIPDPDFRAATKRSWDAQGWRLNVGLSWRSTAVARGGDRTLPHEMLAPLLQQSGATFHSLQYDADTAESTAISRMANRPLWRASNLDPRVEVDRLAAMVAALDLVISADITTVHIAGAVGTPCWVILPAGSDWRWGDQGERTPLYSCLRLFRNRWSGWGGVVADVSDALARWCADSVAAELPPNPPGR